MKERIAQLEDSLQRSQEDSCAFQQRIADLQLLQANLQKAKDLLESEKAQWQQLLESERLASADNAAQVASLERVVENTRRVVDQERNRAAVLEKKLNQKDLELVRSVTVREHLDLQNRDLTKKIEEARNQRERASSELLSLEVQNERYKHRETTATELIEEERATFKTTLDKNMRELVSLKQALRQQSKVLHSRVNNLRDENATLQAQKLSLNSRLHSGGKSLAKIEQDITACFDTFSVQLNHVLADKEMFKANEPRRWKSLEATLATLRLEFTELVSHFKKKVEDETKAKNILAHELESVRVQVDEHARRSHISPLHNLLLSKIFEETREGTAGPRLCLSKLQMAEIWRVVEDARIVRSSYSEIPLGK